ncbi:hypothetical protein EV140_1557 [Microcella alkaliphila]|uniref:Uncharacterized protein n=1 Tax=Microcella alkaliphila TaxID=279828 RepID=A0A4Q7TI52_9MICO|nr:hypothetical protein [Microcella alkaliphila]RZT59577.1 hypothetical protein EV140_1557 [Microcella alkaliphila]
MASPTTTTAAAPPSTPTRTDPALTRHRAWRYVVLILALGQPVSSLLFDVLSDEMMESGAEFSPLIPPGPWFAIWGLIIVASIAWAIALVRPSTIRPATSIRDRLAAPLAVVFAGFALWLATAAFGQDNPLGLVVFVVYLVAFVVAWRRVVAARDEIASWNVVERGLLYLTMGVYSGWVSMAFFVQIGTVVQGAGAPYDTEWGITWQALVLAAAAGLAVLFAVVSRGSIVYALTVTYALIGVGISTADAGLTLLWILAIVAVSVLWASTLIIRVVDARRRMGLSRTRS